jgi:predicted nucleic acid-binding protein
VAARAAENMQEYARVPANAHYTSVFLSAERHELLYLARKKAYTLICSPFLINEVVRRRTEMAIKQGLDSSVYAARINRFVNEISALATMVNHTRLIDGNYTDWLRDPDDVPLLATALVGKAQYIVSWNTRDFPPKGSFAHIRYLIPPQFLEEVEALHPAHISTNDV